MCTLIIGQDVPAPGAVLLAANRDEDPARASAEPGVLHDRPRVVGGKDLVAGGTWLALREGRAAVALLNRRPPANPPPPGALRSRGLLTLDVATVPADFHLSLNPVGQNPEVQVRLQRITASPLGYAGASKVFEELWSHRFAPFSLVWAAPEGSWVFSFDVAGGRRCDSIRPGWHVITHENLDDRSEPRTAWVMDALAGWEPGGFDEAARRLGALLAAHGDAGGGTAAPPVCLHQGRMQTVSSSIVLLGSGGPRYLHASGRPCENRFEDQSILFG